VENELAILGAALLVAGIFARFGRKVGLPSIPFFIVAGIVFGPHTPGAVILDDPDSIHMLAMLGLVLLLFHLGLEFSVDDLLEGGRKLLWAGGAYIALNFGAGLVLGFVGLGFLFDPFGEGSVDRLGALAIVLGALSWAAGSLYSRVAPLPRRPLVSAGLASVCGGVLLLVVSLGSGEPGEAQVSRDSLLALGYLIVAGSFVGFTAYVWLLRVAPISLVGTYAYVNPIVAVFLGWALLGEEITAQMAIAGAAIVVSVALVVRASGTTLEPGRGLLRRRLSSPAAVSGPGV